MVALSLLDLDDQLILTILAYLVPPFEGVTVAIRTGATSSTTTSADKPSLSSLASTNRTCRRLYHLSLDLLWAHVTCTPKFKWDRVGHHVDRHVGTIWSIADTFAASSASSLSWRFPNARIVSYFTSRSKNGKGALVKSMHIVVPEHASTPWLWTCTKPPPNKVQAVHIECTGVGATFPSWLAGLDVKEWYFTLTTPQEKLRFPDVFALPIPNTKCAVNISWDCGDTRPAPVFIEDLKQKLKTARPDAPRKWTKLALNAYLLVDGDLPERTGDNLMPTMGNWGIRRIPYGMWTFDIYEKSTGWHLANTKWGLLGGPRA